MAFSSILLLPRECALSAIWQLDIENAFPQLPPPRLECTSLHRMHNSAHECTKRGASWYLKKIGGQSAKCAINAQEKRKQCSKMRVNALRKKGPAPPRMQPNALCIPQNAENGAKMRSKCTRNAQRMRKKCLRKKGPLIRKIGTGPKVSAPYCSLLHEMPHSLGSAHGVREAWVIFSLCPRGPRRCAWMRALRAPHAAHRACSRLAARTHAPRAGVVRLVERPWAKATIACRCCVGAESWPFSTSSAAPATIFGSAAMS